MCVAEVEVMYKVFFSSTTCVLFLCFLVNLSRCQESRFAAVYPSLYYGPYRHIYPPADIAQDPADCTPSQDVTCPLFISAFFGFGTGGAFSAKEVIPSVQLALDQMNDDPYFLPGYRLHYLLSDANVN